jgi:hypothetical protein
MAAVQWGQIVLAAMLVLGMQILGLDAAVLISVYYRCATCVYSIFWGHLLVAFCTQLAA